MPALAAILLSSTAFLAVPAWAQTAPQQGQQPMVRTESGQAQAAQGATIQSMTNQPVYREGGQEFGRVNRAVRADNGQVFLIIMANNRMVMAPAGQISFQNGRHMMRGSDQQIAAFPEYREGMAGYQPIGANERINLAQGQMQDQGEASRIVVQQPAPQIQVQQAPPQVAIQQAQPNVTVRQPQPEILVRQGAPTVTVDIPQPEIIVRMPQPEVNVAVAQPQVEVRQPQPQVQVVQPQQPQVDVNRAQQAQVTVQPAQPQVTLQQNQAQPQIRYERAEPQIRVNQAQGQPNVRIERMQPGQQAQAAAPERTEEQRRALRDRFGTGAAATTGSVGAATGATRGAAAVPPQQRAMAVSDIARLTVYNMRGEQLGDVERIITNPANNQRYVVIAHGGFLGLLEREVALPIERFAMQGDNRLVVSGVTEADLDAMDTWRTQMSGATEVNNAERISLNVAR